MVGIGNWLWMGVGGLLMLAGLAFVITPSRPQVIQSLWKDMVQRIVIGGLVGLVIFLGWGQIRCSVEHGKASAAAEPSTVTTPEETSSASETVPVEPTEERPASSEAVFWRIVLWINLCLALPWVTAFVTRHVLALKSNAASFALLSGYTVIDLALAMSLGSIRFVGGSGLFALVGILSLALGYNYWSCELVARLWLGRRR